MSNILEENKAFRVGLNKISKLLIDEYYFLSMAQERRSQAQEVCNSMLNLINLDELKTTSS